MTDRMLKLRWDAYFRETLPDRVVTGDNQDVAKLPVVPKELCQINESKSPVAPAWTMII